MKTADLIERHQQAWLAATSHPFLEAVRDGSLAGTTFSAWLIQDAMYVADLVRFQRGLVARAPQKAHATLAGGAEALGAELRWFEQQARECSVWLDAPPLPATRAYRAFLAEMDRAGYPAAITALWAMERSYLEAWSGAAPGAAAYHPFVEHWTTPQFAAYVAELERLAGEALAEGRELEQAEAAFRRVAELERDFWEMAWSGTTGGGR